MFDTVIHQGNANQNHSKISPHTWQNGYYQKTNNKYWQGQGEKGRLVHCQWECKFWAPTMENSMEFSQKVKNRTTISPSNSTSRYLSKKIKGTNLKDKCIPVYCSMIYSSQDMEAPSIPINR